MSDSDVDNPDVVMEDQQKKSKSQEIVLLDSDEEKSGGTDDTTKNGHPEGKIIDETNENETQEEKRKVIISWQCLNPECTVARKEQLVTADNYTLSYFGLDHDPKRKRKVCQTCMAEVEKGRLDLVDMLKEKKALLAERLPVPRDMVLLEDSDEEPVTDSSGDSELEIDVSSDDTGDDDKTAEEKLNSIIDDALGRFDMDFQYRQATIDLTNRMDALKGDFEETDQMFKDLEVEVDGLRQELYKDHTATIKELPPIDLNEEENRVVDKTAQKLPENKQREGSAQVATKSSGSRAAEKTQFSRPVIPRESAPIPPNGVLEKPDLVQGQQAYAMRQNILSVWRKGRVEEVMKKEGTNEVQYKLRFEGQCGGKKSVQTKLLSPKHLAYTGVARVRLQVGTRCIGLYREHKEQDGAFYSGIIAEPPKGINSNRYLVFFDDGYASYIAHEDVRVVCKASSKVWEDIHPNSKEFIQQYLEQYPERPMVKLTVGQVVKTEWDGKWWISRVKQVDASLVQLVFDADGRTEWIYRGSTRLGPLFTEMEQQRLRRQQGQEGLATLGIRRQTLPSKRRNMPYVEYKREDTIESNLTSANNSSGSDPNLDNDGAPRRAVARKSTASRKTEMQPTTKWELEGTTIQMDHPAAQRKQFVPHSCSSVCISDPQYQYVEAEHKTYSFLLLPIILGWERLVSKHRLGGRRKVFYVAPCGRRLRSLDDVHRYLWLTNSNLEIDFFNFDWWLHVRNEFKPAREFCTIKDLSYGKENVPVSCVNSIDRNYPEYLEYCTVRLPQKNVKINTDSDFMTCCDCTDDCQNKDTCACCQLTIQGTSGDRDGHIDRNAGYNHRRLSEIVLTGIYECNSKCACSKTCFNRVVQHPLRMKLQVFKTEKRGWGIRTLHDIPQGSFICVYVGNLFESEEANKQGQNFGDEYFAELDMIEVVERRKDGYESDVSDEGFEETSLILDGSAKLETKRLTEVALTPDNLTEEDSDEGGNSPDEDFKLPSHYLKKKFSQFDDKDNPSSKALKKKLKKKLKKLKNKAKNKDIPSSKLSKQKLSQLDGAHDDDQLEVLQANVKVRELPRRGGFSATVGIAGPKSKKATATKGKFVSTRKLYGRNEDVYIMDAKSIGNIGRYLNHSCNPNVFVQNAFVDTHDMRFPWIAFFASTFVRAGGELCWDYNYEVGSIPGKELYCSCGSEYCRGKLL